MKKIFLKRKLLLVCASVLALPIYSHAAGRYYSSNVKPVNLTKLVCVAGKGYMTLVYQNKSKEAVDLDTLQISYPSLNALKPTRLSVTAGSAGSAPSTSYQDGIEKITPNLTGTVPQWNTLTVIVGDNYLKSNLNANICDNLTLSYGNVTTGIIDIHNKTSKPEGAPVPTVEIDKNDGSKFGTYSVPWDSSFEVRNIAPGKYTVLASTYDIGDSTYTPSIVPESAINIMKGKTTNVSITYKPSTLPGFMSLTAEKPSGFPSDEKKPIITLNDQEHSNLKRMQAISQWGETTIHGLKPRDKYKLSTGSIFIKENSNNCTPTFTPDVITASSPEEEEFQSRLSYTCNVVDTVTGKIVITGAPIEQLRVTIHFKPENDIYPVIDEEIPLQEGKGTITKVQGFIVDQTYTVSIDDISGYTPHFNPSIIKPVAGKTVNETIKYTKSNKLLAAYVMNNYYEPTIHSGDKRTGVNMFNILANNGKGYNAFIFAFLRVQDANVIFDGWTKQSLWMSHLKADIDKAKTTGGVKWVLASLGGEANEFNPGNASLSILAKNLTDVLKKSGFDGVDFDIEMSQPPITSEQLVTLIKDIKKDMPKAIISCAPGFMISGYAKKPLGYLNIISMGTNTWYNDAIKDGLFDYINMQDSFTAEDKIYYENKNGIGKEYDETTPEFAALSVQYLTHQISYPKQQQISPITIPQHTKILPIVPGGPGTATAVGIFGKCGSNCDKVYTLFGQSLQQIAGDNPQFAGVAIWSWHWDAAAPTPYKFLTTVGPYLGLQTQKPSGKL